MNEIMMTQVGGTSLGLNSVFKNQFKNWNLKEQIVINSYEIDNILIANITKIKIYSDQPVQSRYLVKIQETKKNGQQKTHLYALSIQMLGSFFQKIFLFRLNGIGIQFQQSQKKFSKQIQGLCYKKSEIRKIWQQRLVKISKQNGLTSRKPQKQKESLHIKSTKQIWTRFEMLENSQYIVIKVKFLLGKQQFAVPIKQALQWFKAFYSLFQA